MKLANECVVLCAGRGERLLPPLPKTVIDVAGRPLFAHVVEHWRSRVDRFIFVVGYKKRYVIDEARKMGVDCIFVEQHQARGIAHAVSLVRRRVGDDFIIALGDCVQSGVWLDWPDEMSFGVGLWRQDDITQKGRGLEDYKRSYAARVEDGLVTSVVEKPPNTEGYCGMGTYYFTSKVFDYIEHTRPSKLRNEVEITDVIQGMIEAGEIVKPLWFQGDYINVTYPSDLDKAGKMLGVTGAVIA